jgi:beta-lactamase regulating signal transducer with metallopeptidase domain
MLALQCIASATVLYALTWAFTAIRRRCWSAAQRHDGWAAALLASVLCPLILSLDLPRFEPLQPVASAFSAPVAAVESIARTTVEVRGGGASWAHTAAAVWASIAIVLVLWRILGFVRVSGLAAAARPCSSYRGIEVRVCGGIRVPVAVAGSLILLPDESSAWPAWKMESVLLHELAHIQRKDLFLRMAGALAVCIYWFHPLAWLAAARQKEESEMACDDMVLKDGGVAAHEYATALLEVARGLAPVGAVGMAQEKRIETRIAAILDRNRSRAGSSWRRLAVGLASSMLVVLPVGAWQDAGVQMKGAVRDIVGVIPGARLVLTEKSGGSPYTFETGEDGAYAIKGVPEGTYTLEILKPGYQKYSNGNLKISSEKNLQLDHYLQLGKIVETVTVDGGAAPHPQLGGAQPGPQRIRVSGNVQAAKLVTKVVPKYPPAAKQAGVQGTVRMQAVIAKTGEILSLTLLMSPSPELAT